MSRGVVVQVTLPQDVALELKIRASENGQSLASLVRGMLLGQLRSDHDVSTGVKSEDHDP